MAQKIVSESQAGNYASKRYAYTDEATGTDYYIVDDAGSVSMSGNAAASLTAWLNKNAAAATATAATTATAARKKAGQTLLFIALALGAIVIAAWAYRKFIK